MWPQPLFPSAISALDSCTDHPATWSSPTHHTVYASSFTCAVPSACTPFSLCPSLTWQTPEGVSVHRGWLSWLLDRLMPTFLWVSDGPCPPSKQSPPWTRVCSPGSLGEGQRERLCYWSLRTRPQAEGLAHRRHPIKYEWMNAEQRKNETNTGNERRGKNETGWTQDTFHVVTW